MKCYVPVIYQTMYCVYYIPFITVALRIKMLSLVELKRRMSSRELKSFAHGYLARKGWNL